VPTATFSWISVARSPARSSSSREPAERAAAVVVLHLVEQAQRSMRGPRKSVRPNTMSWTSWLMMIGLPRAFSFVVTSTRRGARST
jgi:hypothetical protein